jgi:membrane-associated protease RseP (regulator of RpoE activity)
MIEYPYNVLISFLLFWAVIYILGGKIRGERKKVEITVKPFFLQFKVKDINSFIDRIMSRRFTNFLAIAGLPLGMMLSLAALGFLFYNLYNYFISPPKFTGVTVLVPFVTLQNVTLLSYFFLSIPIILISHEFAHAFVARVQKLNLKGGGFALLGLLFAGFIEPDEEQFKRAKAIKRMKVLAAGSTTNLLVSLLLFSLLVFQPVTAVYMPDSVRTNFYGQPAGVYIYLVDETKGIGAMGAKVGDVIKAIDGHVINTLEDYMALSIKPGQTVNVLLERDGRTIEITMKAIGEGERGRLGFYGFTYYPPLLKVPTYSPWVFGFIYWTAFFSLMVGMFNMLPLYPFDGDGFYTALVELLNREKLTQISRLGLNALSLTLFIGNIVATVMKLGFIVL